jgi:hypothetical protein
MRSSTMNPRMIKDLSMTEELTREALARVAGGFGRIPVIYLPWVTTLGTIVLGPEVGTRIGGQGTAEDGA